MGRRARIPRPLVAVCTFALNKKLANECRPARIGFRLGSARLGEHLGGRPGELAGRVFIHLFTALPKRLHFSPVPRRARAALACSPAISEVAPPSDGRAPAEASGEKARREPEKRPARPKVGARLQRVAANTMACLGASSGLRAPALVAFARAGLSRAAAGGCASSGYINWPPSGRQGLQANAMDGKVCAHSASGRAFFGPSCPPWPGPPIFGSHKWAEPARLVAGRRLIDSSCAGEPDKHSGRAAPASLALISATGALRPLGRRPLFVPGRLSIEVPDRKGARPHSRPTAHECVT